MARAVLVSRLRCNATACSREQRGLGCPSATHRAPLLCERSLALRTPRMAIVHGRLSLVSRLLSCLSCLLDLGCRTTHALMFCARARCAEGRRGVYGRLWADIRRHPLQEGPPSELLHTQRHPHKQGTQDASQELLQASNEQCPVPKSWTARCNTPGSMTWLH